MASVPVNTDLDLGGVARVRNLVAPTNPDEPVRNDDSRLGVGGSDPIGTIRYAPSSPGANWLLCDAGVYSQTTEAALFAVLGLSLTGENMAVTTRTIPSGTWRGVTYGAGLFVAVGTNVCATSPDGITWSTRTIPAGTWYDIAWNGSVFVAVNGAAAATTCATSPDGITWTSRTIPSGSWQGVAWGAGVFVATDATSGSTKVATSPDGITWTSRTAPSASRYRVAFGGGVFAAVAASGLHTSPDGITWTYRPFAGLPAAAGIVWDGARFIAVGGASGTAISYDGITWLDRSWTSADSGYGNAFGAGLLVSVYTGKVSWARKDLVHMKELLTGTWESVCFALNKFVIVRADASSTTCATLDPTYNTSTHFEVPKITPDDPRLKAYIKKA